MKGLFTNKQTRRALLYTGLAVWASALLVTFFLVARYKMTPGEIGDAPARWPSDSLVHRAEGRANIVMVAHPQCPCTVASLAELSRLAGDLHGTAKIHVLLVLPDDTSSEFAEGRIEQRARAIPDVDIVVDRGGAEAARFGAIVSGTTFAYGRDGALVFKGGLTIARGHEGRGPAHDRIIALLAGSGADRTDAPTFGCALEDADARVSEAR